MTLIIEQLKKLHLVLFISSLLSTVSYGYDSILGWDSALPSAEERLISAIQVEAFNRFHFSGENASCGGQTSNLSLSDYYTFEAYDGELTHKVRVLFHATSSLNHCSAELLQECEASATLLSDGNILLGRLSCTVIE